MVQQISVFLQNKSGKIASITQAFKEKRIDIRALSIADTTDFGILRMLVNDLQTAKATLEQQNCIFSINEVIVAAVPDQPGGLAQVLTLLASYGIDIEYMYSLLSRGKEAAYMVFRVTDEEAMRKVLEKHGIRTVTGDFLGLA